MKLRELEKFKSDSPKRTKIELCKIAKIYWGLRGSKVEKHHGKVYYNILFITRSWFKIPHGVASDSGYYVLAVNGTGGATFSERKYIRFVEKGFTIYIQTDKAVYKPGQNGRYSIISVL